MGELVKQIAGISFITQEVIDKFGERYLDMANEAGLDSADIDMDMAQWKGGVCAKCGTAYSEHTTINRYATFEWFAPECNCELRLVNHDGVELYEIAPTVTGVTRIIDRMRFAGVPKDYLEISMATWDNSCEDRTTMAFRQVYEYACTNRSYKTGKSLILYGSVGTGKTHCAIGALREIAAEGKSILFVSAAALVQEIMRSKTAFQNKIENSYAVLLDDMDKLGSLQSDWVRERVFSLIDSRLSSNRVLIGTTNFKQAGDFTDKLGDAIMSRIIAKSNFIEFEGRDYRQKQATIQ